MLAKFFALAALKLLKSALLKHSGCLALMPSSDHLSGSLNLFTSDQSQAMPDTSAELSTSLPVQEEVQKKVMPGDTVDARTVHAMTVDVEDYFHVAALAKAIKPEDWDNWPSRVERNTQRLLALFDEKKIKATFFVLGWVADRYPEIVKDIVAQGHELASHGYTHQLVYSQTPEVFRAESERSKKLLEDISGQQIEGYRAASYSITKKSLWALDILSELGFTWDSSIFPVHHDRYGIPGSPEQPYEIQTNEAIIKELPLTTAKVAGLTLPAAGGGYFRQYPYPLSRYLFKKAANKAIARADKHHSTQNRPTLSETSQIFYLHPWEIDPDQPKVGNISRFSRFRHYTNLDKCYTRLERMIDDFHFGRVSDCFQAAADLPRIKIDELAA